MSTKKKSDTFKAKTDTEYSADLIAQLAQAIASGDNEKAKSLRETVEGYCGSLLQRQTDIEQKVNDLAREGLRLQGLRQSLQDAATALRDIRNCRG